MLLIAKTFLESIADFLKVTQPLEWIGVTTGLACVWLAAKNNIWNWPLACISVITYVFIFYKGKLYADAGLQVYFLIMNIYGWYFWSKQRHQETTTRKITTIKRSEITWSVVATLIFTLVLGVTLFKKTDAAFPFVDSFCTALSIIAQVFLARKVLQNWLIWIFVDIIYVGVYFSKSLYATGIMYAVYIIIATIGYLDWRKAYREQTH